MPPQLMPNGTDVTAPEPDPDFETVSRYEFNVKVAVTLVSADSVTAQVPVPLQPPPDHPVNVEPGDAVAERSTVPGLKLPEQVAPQSIPAGVDVTVPDPVPDFETVSTGLDAELNVAVTVVAPVMVTTQLPVPLQPPPAQPANVEPGDAVAVNVTTVPWVKDTPHVAPQSMPPTFEVTVPAPAPVRLTVNV